MYLEALEQLAAWSYDLRERCTAAMEVTVTYPDPHMSEETAELWGDQEMCSSHATLQVEHPNKSPCLIAGEVWLANIAAVVVSGEVLTPCRVCLSFALLLVAHPVGTAAGDILVADQHEFRMLCAHQW